jgi:hypothetical protein
MTRSRRFLAAVAAVLPLLGAVGTVGSAGGCSGDGALPPTQRDDAADKAGQDKMREFMQQKTTKGRVQKGIR